MPDSNERKLMEHQTFSIEGCQTGRSRMYQFARCQSHPNYPDMQGWYLVLKPGDVGTLMELHRAIARKYFCKFAMDPHLTMEKCPGFYGPVALAGKWLETVEKYLLQWDTIVVNSGGGLLTLADVKVLSTVESETMSWPDIYEDEVVTISRWSEGLHFYLSSNKDRIFSPGKYNTYEDALKAAKKYTENIRTKDSL